MNSFSIPPIVMAGITFYVGIYHLLIYFRQTQHRENLTFALACFTVGCYDVFSAGLYSATSLTEGIRWQRAQIVTLALVGVAFLWFIADYVSHTSRKWVLAFSAYFVLAAIVGLVDRSGLTWSVDQSAIKDIRLLFGLETTYYEVAPGPLTNLQSIMGIGASLYTFWLSVRFYRSGRQKEARPLLLAITLFYASVINDTAVSSGLYQFIYLIEYAYMGMVLLMTYSLTDAVVAAAVMKQALQESEEKYRTLFESSSESIILIGLDGAVLDCNDATTKISGLPTEEMIGRAFMELGLLSEEDVPKYADLFSQAISKGETSSLELKIIRSGSATRWIEVFPALLKKDGNVYAVQVIISDITERVRAAEMLRRRNRELTTLYEAAAAISSDLSLHIVLQTVAEQMTQALDSSGCALSLWNRERNRTETLVDYSAARPDETELPGASYDLNDYPASRRVLKTRQPMVIQFDDPLANEAELALMEKQGVRTLLILPLIVRDQVLGLMELTEETKIRDYTPEEIRLAQSLAAQAAVAIENARMFAQEEQHTAELARALEQQQELDRLRSDFIRNVSHEVRTPLAVARGHAELLETGVMGELQPEQRESVAIIAHRMQVLSEMMNDFAAIIDVEAELQRRPVDLAELMRRLLTDSQVRIAAGQADLTLTVEVAPDAPPVSGDPIQLQRVMDNLLDNAFKFTPAGGHVTVRLGQRGENLVLEVSDTGIGIPDDQLERVFERFYQIDGSTTRRYGGTGLGLALVKEIVQAHGGQVTVQSIVGQGSTFSVTLPICPVDLSYCT